MTTPPGGRVSRKAGSVMCAGDGRRMGIPWFEPRVWRRAAPAAPWTGETPASLGRAGGSDRTRAGEMPASRMGTLTAAEPSLLARRRWQAGRPSKQKKTALTSSRLLPLSNCGSRTASPLASWRLNERRDENGGGLAMHGMPSLARHRGCDVEPATGGCPLAGCGVSWACFASCDPILVGGQLGAANARSTRGFGSFGGASW